ncbi:CPBP family intramembrane glutamic endopeptidase [Marinilabilia salmonicolor]|uniref:CPBP family intramembrane glutamic endopeptidase n=1 Tax=Marinilabilia salmonicolor TaxID=989 RepID=UPI00029A8F8C|nr:CPBP family intramembrane glutamic endopeptidase [Marinilabilia salmonicolor]
MKEMWSHLGGFGKLLVTVLLVFTSFMVFSLIAVLAALPFSDGLSLLDGPQASLTTGMLRYFQIVQSISVFIIPSLLAGLLFWGHLTRGIGFSKPQGGSVILSLLIILVSQPLVSYLGIWNSSMELPDALRGLEQWMARSEENAADFIFQILDTDAPAILLLNILMIAILPALGEEMLFRGVLQPVFGEWFRSKHLAVLVTAFLFSAIHLQFFTFMPRFFLGLALGYLMVWSKNLWYPVAGHFANNFLSLAIFYFYRHTNPDINPLEPEAEMLSPVWLLPSVVLLFWLSWAFFRKENSLKS